MAAIYERDSDTNCRKDFYFSRADGTTPALSTDEKTKKNTDTRNKNFLHIELKDLDPDFQRILAKHNLKGKKKRSW